MSFFKNSWKDEWNYGSIFKVVLAAIIVIAITSGYNIISGGKLRVGNIFTEEGKDTLRETAVNFWNNASQIGRGILVTIILVASIFIYGYFGMIDKEASVLWGILSLITAITVGAYSMSFKTAFFFAWIMNIIILFFAQGKKNIDSRKGIEETEDNPLSGQESWLLFGITSIFIAPFFSLTSGSKGNVLLFWVFFGVLGYFGFLPFTSIKKSRAFFSKAVKKTKDTIKNIFKKAWDWLIYIESLSNKLQKSSAEDIKKALQTKRIFEEIGNLVKEGKYTEANTVLQQKLPEIENFKIEEMKTGDTNGVGAELRKVVADENEKAEKTEAALKDKNKIAKSKLGKVKQHLHDLGKLFYQGNKEEVFLKFKEMKESNFKELVSVLKSTENPLFIEYANELEKKSRKKKFWVPEFLSLIAKWSKEIDESLFDYIKILEKNKKANEKKTKKSIEKAHKADEKMLAILENARELAKMDKYATDAMKKVVSGMERIKDALKEGNPGKISKAIEDIKEYVDWMAEYVPKRKPALKLMLEQIEEAKKELNKAGEEAIKLTTELAKVESIGDKVGAE